MYCKNCGKMINDKAAFCNNCGIQVAKNMEIRQQKPIDSEITIVEQQNNNKEKAILPLAYPDIDEKNTRKILLRGGRMARMGYRREYVLDIDDSEVCIRYSFKKKIDNLTLNRIQSIQSSFGMTWVVYICFIIFLPLLPEVGLEAILSVFPVLLIFLFLSKRHRIVIKCDDKKYVVCAESKKQRDLLLDELKSRRGFKAEIKSSIDLVQLVFFIVALIVCVSGMIISFVVSLGNESELESTKTTEVTTERISEEVSDSEDTITESEKLEKNKNDVSMTEEKTETISDGNSMKVYACGSDLLKIMDGVAIYTSQNETIVDYNMSIYYDDSGQQICCLHDSDGFEYNYVYDKDNDTYVDWNNSDIIYKRIETNENPDFVISYSSSRLLEEKDIRDMTVQELNYAKNEIYARHGYIFKSEELQNYFGLKDWYQGKYDSNQMEQYSPLSEIEKKNVKFLSQKEENLGGYELDK